MNKKEERIFFKTRHIENLGKLFNLDYNDAEGLYRSLRRIETKLNRIYEVACERELWPQETEVKTRLKERAKKLTKNANGLIFNSDPRGYSIKIDDQVNRELRNQGINLYSDWGGYGILAPDFN